MTIARLSKKQLRKALRDQRHDLDPASRMQWDKEINRAVLHLAEENQVSSLSAFWPFDGEPDIRPALRELANQSVLIVLPVITNHQDQPALSFHRWTDSSVMKKNRFGITEPEPDERVSLTELDLVLVPLLGWDQQGHRLGMGAGYYDRAMSGIRERSRPLRAGIAYQLQKVDDLPSDPWDVDLHLVMTEQGRFTCSR